MSRVFITDACCNVDLHPPGQIDDNDLECLHQSDFVWKTPELAALPFEVGFSVYSDAFAFDGTIWRIRTYSKGLTEENDGRISFMLIRIGSHAPRFHGVISCIFGVQKNDGNREILAKLISQQSDLKLGPIEFLPVSEACNVENNFIQDSKITFFCTMKYGDGTDATGISEMTSSILDEQQMVGIFSKKTKTSSVQEVTWELANFSELLMIVGYYVTSRPFRFEDRTYRMRLYPNGQSENETDGWICLVLLTSEHENSVQSVVCKIGLKHSSSEISEEHGLKGSEKLLGPIKLWPRSEINVKLTTVTAFCTLRSEKIKSTLLTIQLDGNVQSDHLRKRLV